MFEQLSKEKKDEPQESRLRHSMKERIGSLMEENDSKVMVEKIIKEIDEFTDGISEALITRDTVNVMKENVRLCENITDKEEFLEKIMIAYNPLTTLLEENHPYIEEKRAERLSKDLTRLNRLIAYEVIDDSIVKLHHLPGSTVDNKRALYFSAMKDLAEIVDKNKDIKAIQGHSWIVNEHPHLFERFGFEVAQTLDDDGKQKKDSGGDYMSTASISREKFLEQFLKK